MRLSDLAAAIPGAVVVSGGDFDVQTVRQDSRSTGPGDLFVAVAGITVDGHDFAAEAARRGAAVAIQSEVPLPEGAAVLRLPSTRTGLAELAAEVNGRPARRLRMIAMTGTDGKTTSTHMTAHVLRSAGLKVGAMSSVSFMLGDGEEDNLSGQSTIEPTAVQGQLRRFVEAGAEAAVVEVTSHAIVQERVGACDFDVAGFTNIGSDHLDYHGTQQAYREAKARLIDLCRSSFNKGIPKTAVLNRDDSSYEFLRTRDIDRRWSYSALEPADIRASEIRPHGMGTAFLLSTGTASARVFLQVPALFNVSNSLCAAGAGLAVGLTLDQVAAGLSSFPGVRGRLEMVNAGQDFGVVIDFAHAAGALTTVLRELRPLTRGRLIVVFGTTARSDHDRPGMGRAAAQGSDYFVITTDDPVDMDPGELARQVQAGVTGRQPGLDYEIILDRRAAIRHAIAIAREGDTVLLAGKGHERSMVVAGGREPWDERAEAEAAIRDRPA